MAPQRIANMAAIMIVQMAAFVGIAINPARWLFFFIIWWLLAACFWYQFTKAMRGE